MIEAIILAGGLGTRLREAVSDVPKSMAPINGKPFLAYLLENLAKNGVQKVILAVGYKYENIIEYFGSSFNEMSLVYSIEDIPLGTGGAVKKALELTTQDHVYVLNGDTFFEFDIRSLETHWSSAKSSVIVGAQTQDTSRYGNILVDSNSKKIYGFSEKGKSGPGIINAGCYLISVEDFKKSNFKDSFSIESDYFPQAIKMYDIHCVEISKYFIDIGTPTSYKEFINFSKLNHD